MRNDSLSLDDVELGGIARLRSIAQRWCNEHSVPVGVVEMAIGAGLLHWGVTRGAINLGERLVGLAHPIQGGGLGAAIGGALGLSIGPIMGNIGIVAGGTAVGVSAAILSGGAAVILSATGFGVDSAVHRWLSSFNPADAIKPCSALGVGLFLLVDGGRRVYRGMKRKLASIDGMTIWFPRIKAEIVLRSLDDLQSFVASARVKSGFGLVAGGLGGAAAGSSIAASSVTVLGSHALGAAALSLGVISAPVWPVVALGTVCAVAGGAAMSGRLRRRTEV